MCGVLRIGSRRVASVAGRTDLSLRIDDERSTGTAGLVGDIGLGVRRIQLVVGVRRRIDRAAVGRQFAGTVDELTSVRATVGLEDILGGIRFALKRAALEIGLRSPDRHSNWQRTSSSSSSGNATPRYGNVPCAPCIPRPTNSKPK